jgi:hypothetical protein
MSYCVERRATVRSLWSAEFVFRSARNRARRIRRAGFATTANPWLSARCRKQKRRKSRPQPPGVERMRSTGNQGCDTCVARAYMDVRPGLERSRECAAQWLPRACAQHGLRSAMALRRFGKQITLHSGDPENKQRSTSLFEHHVRHTRFEAGIDYRSAVKSNEACAHIRGQSRRVNAKIVPNTSPVIDACWAPGNP